MTDQRALEHRKYALTLTGSTAARTMLADVRCHLKFNHPGATCSEFSDFGGRSNPIARVDVVSPRAKVNDSVSWMRKRAGNKFPFSVIVEDLGPAKSQEHTHPAKPAETAKSAETVKSAEAAEL